MEHKRLRIHVKSVEEKGIVEAFTAVFGNVDYQGDIIDPGAFTKTLQERQGDIQVLDNHNTRSCRDVVGKIVDAKEVGVDDLPVEVKEKYPDAEGGLLVKIQFLMDTEEGAGIFKRIKSDAIRQYSIGYDPIVTKRDTVPVGEDEMSVRRLKELRLWEVSPVIFGANSATSTVSAKSMDEQKPWDVFKEDGEYCVYKIDTDGERIGDPEGCHDTRESADEQLAALYASEEGEKEYSLIEQFDMVFIAFVTENENMSVEGIYGTHLIAQDEDGTTYRVGYDLADGEVVFAGREDWIEGRVEFVPANKSNPIEKGKVGAKRNLPLASKELEWDADAAISSVREWAGGDKENIDWSKYRQAFFWYDSTDEENFGAYKLPFARVSDGKLTAIPRGVFAAAAAISGARGGVDIPDGDTDDVKSAINSYYEDMDEKPPWDKSLDEGQVFLHAFLEALEKAGWHIVDGHLADRPEIQRAVARAILQDAREKNSGDAIGVAISRFLALSTDTKEAGPPPEAPTSEKKSDQPPVDLDELEHELSEIKEMLL